MGGWFGTPYGMWLETILHVFLEVLGRHSAVAFPGYVGGDTTRVSCWGWTLALLASSI